MNTSSDDDKPPRFLDLEFSKGERLEALPAEDTLKRDLNIHNSSENFESQLLPLQSGAAQRGPNFRSSSTRNNSTETRASGPNRTVLFVSIVLLAFFSAVFSAMQTIPGAFDACAGQSSAILGIRPVALSKFKTVWHNDPGKVGIFINWANTRAAFNKSDAINWYADCISINPKFASCYLNRGLNFYNLGDDDNALADYKKAIDLNPRYALAYSNRAAIDRKRKQFSAELSDMNEAIKFNDKNATFFYNRALAYHDLGQFDKAAKDLYRAKELGFNGLLVDAEMQSVLTKKPSPSIDQFRPVGLGEISNFIFMAILAIVSFYCLWQTRFTKVEHPISILARKYPMTIESSFLNFKQASYFDFGYRHDIILIAFDQRGLVLRLTSSKFTSGIGETAFIPWSSISSIIDTKDWMALVRVVKLKNRQELKFSHAELDGAEAFFPISRE